MQGCGLTSLVACTNDKIFDIRERNVTIRGEIGTTNIHSYILGILESEWYIELDITEFMVYHLR